MSNKKHTDGYPPYLFLEDGRVDKDHPENNWWQTKRRRYDLTYELVMGILEFQEYKCPVSGEDLDLSKGEMRNGVGAFKWFVDHDHKYGEAQGSNYPGLASVRGFVTRESNELMKSIDLLHNSPPPGTQLIIDHDSLIGQYLFNPPAQQYINSLDTCLIK